jgi:uncharacterized protein (DUF952 family)
MDLIYHIADSNHWEQAQSTGIYIHPSLHTEGFIHCSTASQLEETANLYFNSQPSILILTIDPGKVKPEIKFERSARGQDFPHIYGPLNIVGTQRVEKKQGNTFKVPLHS